MANTKYTLQEPMRWDQVSFAAYGDVYQMNQLIEANQGVSAYDVIPEGTELEIPILSVPETDTTLLPPWKR